MKGIFTLALVASTVFLFISCKKYEGEGGKSTIVGKIMIELHTYNYQGITPYDEDIITMTGSGEDVFIVYGNESVTPDDKVETGYDGTFKFRYLQPGTYTIYAYSEIWHKGADANSNDDDYYTKEVVSQTVELGKKEDLDLGTITLIK